MQKKPYAWSEIESELRHAAPKLREAESVHVDAVCARIAAEPPARGCGSDRPTALGRHLARAAACLVLAFGLALYLRMTSAPVPPSADLSNLPAEVANVWGSVEAAPNLDATLATEAENLTADFDELAIAINNHALALLF